MITLIVHDCPSDRVPPALAVIAAHGLTAGAWPEPSDRIELGEPVLAEDAPQ